MKKLKVFALSMILVLGLSVVIYNTNDKMANSQEKKYQNQEMVTLSNNEDNTHKAVNEDKENTNLKTVRFNNADESGNVDKNKGQNVNSSNKRNAKTVSTVSKAQPKAKASNKVTASRGNLKAAISYNAKELDLLARLVRAEAGGESYSAQVAVAAVVINRVKSSKFPNTITAVINSNNQFTPVQNGQINKPATDANKKAVQEALYGKDPSNGALFFYDTSCTSKWLLSKPVKAKIGKMVYAY
ncbi:cell wall hydrolase [Clostridium sp. BSD9I1]|uniref:cell wall hydrolase n=1 Tax=Clostridium sp. BSD9I1 TaxID=2003589 RepID=UPI0016489C38|nr:cell wall hydrolase [Clostridium sp. BSD9I1]